MCKTSLQTLGGVRQDKKGKSIDTGSETGFQRQICRHGVGWDRIPKTRIQTWGGVDRRIKQTHGGSNQLVTLGPWFCPQIKSYKHEMD